MDLFRGFRALFNVIGFAWWAKVETSEPKVTYWFGPFLTRRSLVGKLSAFSQELSIEGSHSIKHQLVRCHREEPLTI